MPHATSDSKAISLDLGRLDQLLAVLERRAESQLLIEHLHSARTYLLGAMPAEYKGSLEDAREASQQVANPQLREMIQELLGYMLAEASQRSGPGEEHHSQRPSSHERPPDGAKSKLWEFFSSAYTSFGVFYPQKYVIGAFPSFEAAKAAENALKQANFPDRDVLAITGGEMLDFLEELSAYEGIWGALMARLSRTFGTEEIFVDDDIRRAHAGAGFLAVYSPEDGESERIRELTAPFAPLSMQRYLASGIQSLI